MGATTSGGLRYPTSTDVVNIPSDLANLANDVQTYITNNALTTTGTYTLSNKTIAGTGLLFAGSTSGTTNVKASAVAGTTTLTLPAITDTLVGLSTVDTLANKTFAASIKINGSGSGSTIITAAATAGAPNTITLPIVDGTMAMTSDLGNSEMFIVMGVYGG
jgi:hypothetical protein